MRLAPAPPIDNAIAKTLIYVTILIYGRCMKNTIRILCGSALLGCSTLYAGTMGPTCTPENVSVPCHATALEFGLTGLYLEPYTNLLFPQSFGSFYNVDNNYNTPWSWGGILEAGYHFNQGNDVNVNWLHYTNTGHYNLIEPYGDENTGDTSLSTHERLNARFDLVNAELAQTIVLGSEAKVRMHGGIQYLYTKISDNYNDIFNVSRDQSSFIHPTSYEGAGPRMGVDGSHNIGHGFAVFANGAAAILLGETKGTTFYNQRVSVPVKYNHAVPELNGTIGLSYLMPTTKGDFSISGGWSAIYLFSLLPSKIANGQQQIHDSLALSGPFLTAKWVGSLS